MLIQRRTLLSSNNPFTGGKVYKFTTPGINPMLLSRPLTYIPSDEDRLHTIVEGEDLSIIAGIYYEDSKNWKPIADANNITNPLDLTNYQDLIIPNIEKTKTSGI